MKIAFHVYQFTFRGTEVAIFDYALYNITLLGNESIIVTPYSNKDRVSSIEGQKFSKEFKILFYNDVDDLSRVCRENSIDMFYVLKYGKNDGVYLEDIKTVVHCVFSTDEPHGHIYSGVSKSVSRCNNKNTIFPTVEHIVYLPDLKTDYRDYLGIPKNDIVIGRHGGVDTFNIPFVKECILKILEYKSDIWFLFCVKPSIMEGVDHPRIKYLSSFSDNRVKRKFINTCDYMLHASILGESFGLSVLEFYVCNKIVITWNGGHWHKQHIDNLGCDAVLYNNEQELTTILSSLKRDYVCKNNNRFSPEKIMKDFKREFIDVCIVDID